MQLLRARFFCSARFSEDEAGDWSSAVEGREVDLELVLEVGSTGAYFLETEPEVATLAASSTILMVLFNLSKFLLIVFLF